MTIPRRAATSAVVSRTHTASNKPPAVTIDDTDSASLDAARCPDVDNNITSVGAPDACLLTLNINILHYMRKDQSIIELPISEISFDPPTAQTLLFQQINGRKFRSGWTTISSAISKTRQIS